MMDRSFVRVSARTFATALFVIAASAAAEAISACGPIGPVGADGASSRRDGGAAFDASTSSGSGGDGAPTTTTDGEAPPAPIGGNSSDAHAPGGYYVNGPTIFTAAGVPHLFHGVDRPSLEWNRNGEQLSPDDYKLMVTWKANVARISLNQGFWLASSKVYSAGYAAVVDQNVRWAHEAGMDVILDLHWSDRGDYAVTPDQQTMADAHSLAFWRDVAARYKDDGRVLFELYNEPHDVTWDVWRNGGRTSDGFTAVGMQALYDAVRATGAENLVLIGGLSYAFDLSGVRNYRIAGHNIVYVTHPYDTPTKQRVTWENSFGYLTQTDPVMATEFGNLKDCGTTYYSQFLEYAQQKNVSWTGWAWFVSGCTFPSLISDWSGTPTASGQLVRAALLAY